MSEGLRFGIKLNDLNQEILDEVLDVYKRIVQPPEFPVDPPITVGRLHEQLIASGVVELRLGSKFYTWSDFRAIAHGAPPNPLVRFSFEPNLERTDPRNKEALDLRLIYEIAVVSHLIDRGLAVEI